MAILTLKAEWSGNLRTKTYPRIGGGARHKSYGFSHGVLKVEGICDAATDLAYLETALETNLVVTLNAPLSGGVNKIYRILVTSPWYRPLGGGILAWGFDGLIVVT